MILVVYKDSCKRRTKKLNPEHIQVTVATTMLLIIIIIPINETLNL